MGKIKRMDQVRQIIRTYIATDSIKATARRLQVSMNTVRGYSRIGEKHHQDLPALLELSDGELLTIFYLPDTKAYPQRKAVFDTKVDYWLKELHRVGVTRYLLWEEYRKKHQEGFASEDYWIIRNWMLCGKLW